ncbi:MAG TPA: glycosyltransferase family 4 protein [Sedimentisphaerales bacterium]|nr:glycosyltransferase family 4 protein [Sedimentisphaerales bacterium]
MNILILTNNPTRASFRQRIAVYLEVLRDNGIECEVARFPPGSLARWKLLKRSADFDGVFLHKKRLNLLDAFWLRRYAQKVIYDFDDAIMYSDKHPGRPSRKRQKSFQRTVELADMVIADNSYLAEHARKYNPSVEVLPTGLDTCAYKLKAGPENNDKTRLVWIGSKSTLPYLAEIKPALEEIGSRFDDVVLRIVCDDFFDLENMQVEKRRWSLENQAVDLATSHIGLAPLPDNKFTQSRFCFKILQYAAAGLPVIASPIGANTEYVREGSNGFLAGDSSEWIDKISRLLSDSQLRKQMGQAGRADVQRFDLKVQGEQLLNLINGCLKNIET